MPPLSRKETRVSVARGFGGPGRGATLRSVQAEPGATSGLLRDLLLRGGQSWAPMKDSPPHLAAPGYALPALHLQGRGLAAFPRVPGQLGSLALREGRWGSGVPEPQASRRGPIDPWGPRT